MKMPKVFAVLVGDVIRRETRGKSSELSRKTFVCELTCFRRRLDLCSETKLDSRST